MKRTLHLATAILLAMPMAGNEANGQSMMSSHGQQFAIGSQGQNRRRPLYNQGRRKRPYKVMVRSRAADLSTAKMWMLTNQLDLTEAQATKLFPRMKDNQQARNKLHQERNELVSVFSKKVRNNKASQRDVEKFADELGKIEKELIDLKTKLVKSTKDILEPDQQAAFAIFEEVSRGKLRDRLRNSGVVIEFDPYFEFHFDDDD